MSDMLRQRKSQPKKSKKGGAKGSVALMKESTQVGCVCLKILIRENPFNVNKENWDQNIKFSKGTWHQIKVRERKGPSRGIIQKCAPHARSPCAPKFGERSHEETLLAPRRMRPQSSTGFGEKYVQAQECGQSYVSYSY